ncbi:MAG: lamin tail domain-containing protein, partial [Ardenticatenales bacterium]
ADVPAATELHLPVDVDAARTLLESREGMRVALPDVRAIGGTDAHGEVPVVESAAGVEHLLRTAADDGRRMILVAPGDWPVVAQGDVLADVVGPLDYTFGEYKVDVADWSAVGRTAGGRQPDTFAPAGVGELTAATFNVENLFDEIDDPGKSDTEGTYFPRSHAEYLSFVDRRAKAIDERLGRPDIVSIEEIEKLPILEDLAANPRLAPADYGAALIEGVDARGIDVGVLYNRAKLRLIGVEQRQKCMDAAAAGDAGVAPCTLPGGGAGQMIFSRPPLVVRLALRGTDARITVIANHFKSKGGGDAVTTATRVLEAKHIVDIVRELQAAEPATPVFVMGDLNDFPDSPPIQEIVGTGLLVDLHDRVPDDQDYTFIFNGVAQVLDYILVPPAFAAANVTEALVAHINVDFPSHPPVNQSPEPPPFETSRVSDHNPFFIRFKRFGRERYVAFLPALLSNGAFQGVEAGGSGTDAPTPAAATSTPDDPSRPTAAPTDEPVPTPSPVPPHPTPGPSPTAGASPTPSAGEPPRTPLRITTLFYDGVVPNTEADEYIEVENVTGAPVALGGWRVTSLRGTNQVYAFPASAVIDPGPEGRCRVYTNEDHPERACSFNWGSAQAIWSNAGDKAELRDASGAVIDHRCYGESPWGNACGAATATAVP